MSPIPGETAFRDSGGWGAFPLLLGNSLVTLRGLSAGVGVMARLPGVPQIDSKVRLRRC